MEYKSAVDAKGRMSFPSKLREEIGEAFVITKAMDASCIKVYSKADWKELVAKMREMPQTQTAGIQRFVIGSKQEIEPDGQGRFVVNAPLREYAGIESEAIIVGLEGRAEIWSKVNWEHETSGENREKLVDIALQLGL